MIKKNGFTLIELAIAAIIIGILILVGIPNMLKSTNRGYATDAMRNLMALYAAQHSWMQNNGEVNFRTCGDISSCNADLDLNIVSVGGITYSCNSTGSNDICTASRNGSFTMLADLKLPITINSSPVYCDGNYPTSTSANPCCQGAGTSLCP